MKSYEIQHDYLFASDDIAREGPPLFDAPKNKRETISSTPVKASLLIGCDGQAMLDEFSKTKKPIILIDDLPTADNPIVLAYRSLLIKGIVAEFHKRGNKVFQRPS